MNMASHGKFAPTSKRNPCPICGNTSGHCKSKDGVNGDTLIYCHNNQASPGQHIAGYKWIKAAAMAGWQGGIFAPVDSQGPGQKTSSAKSIAKIDYPTAGERDRQYRAYMSKLTLHPDDRADLVRRGVADVVIEGMVSKEGKEPGYICPCYNPDGQIVGAQWRLRDSGDGPRYKWINWICGGAEHQGELPLTIHRPLGDVVPGVAIVEGIGAKSMILAQRSGMVTIGAGANSQFAGCSDNHWRDYLAALDSKVLCFYPDSGCLTNAQVMSSYSRFFEFATANGYEVQVAWWGQVDKGSDIDEIDDWSLIEWLSVAEFEAMVEPPAPPKESAWECMAVHSHQLGNWKSKDVTGDGEQRYWASLAASNPHIEFVSERMGQANGAAPAHLIQVYRTFTPECDFDLRVKRMIAPAHGGEGQTEWEIIQIQGGRVAKHTAVVPETATTKADKFIDALKSASGASITNRANYRMLSAVIQNRRSEYRNNGGKTYKLAPVIGQQEDGYWIFEGQQFTPQGIPCTEEESGWLFDRGLVFAENLHSPKIKPEDAGALSRLAAAEQDCFHPLVLPFVWAEHGNVLAGLHRQHLKQKGFKSFPPSMSTGEKGVGKTSALQAAAAVTDMHHNRAIVGAGVTESALDVRLSLLSGLPLIVDDPFPLAGGNQAEIKAVEKIIVGAIQRSYDQAPRPVRNGSNRPPVATLCLSMNRGMGGKASALDTRILAKEYATGQPDWTNGQELTNAMDGASGGLGALLRCEIDIDIINQYRLKFLQAMPMAQARQAEALAIQCYFTEQYCKLAGVEFDAFEWHLRVLCKQANATETGKDSLSDFLAKLMIMMMDGSVDESNCTRISKRMGGGAYLALHMPSIWELFEKRFSPNYNRSTIEALIEAQGGEVDQQTQKFVANRKAWKDYEAALNRYKMDGQGDSPKLPKKTAARKCVLIPIALVDAAIGRDDAAAANFSTYESDYETPPQPQAKPAAQESPAPEADAVMAVVVVASAGLEEGDEVVLVGDILSAGDGRQYTAVIAPDGTQVSVWLDGLRLIDIERHANG
jgi:hypothetical protein